MFYLIQYAPNKRTERGEIVTCVNSLQHSLMCALCFYCLMTSSIRPDEYHLEHCMTPNCMIYKETTFGLTIIVLNL